MEPRIQYATTTDGVNIAFSAMGEGPPLVHMPRHPFSHIELEWQFPEMRRWYERLAQKRTLVRYDGRGRLAVTPATGQSSPSRLTTF